MKTKPFSQDVIDRLLIAKDLLEKISSSPIVNPDRYTVARHVLTAHNAAELAIAGIAHYLWKLPQSPKAFLMDYFSPIAQIHPDKEVPGKDYFSQLNTVRTAIKHQGLFPDPKQWFRVGEITRNYVSIWCDNYLNISLDDLDESDMITDTDVKKQYNIAKQAFDDGKHKSVLENLVNKTLEKRPVFQKIDTQGNPVLDLNGKPVLDSLYTINSLRITFFNIADSIKELLNSFLTTLGVLIIATGLLLITNIQLMSVEDRLCEDTTRSV